MTEYATLRKQIVGDVKLNKNQYDSMLNDPEIASGDIRSFYESYYKLHNAHNALFEHDRANHLIIKTAIDSLRG